MHILIREIGRWTRNNYRKEESSSRTISVKRLVKKYLQKVAHSLFEHTSRADKLSHLEGDEKIMTLGTIKLYLYNVSSNIIYYIK